MAAKKGKVSRKYRQATSAAKKDAASAFTQNKVKAVRKDSKVKISAEDKEALRNVRKETKEGYITDDKGNKVKVKVQSTADRVAQDKASIRARTDRPDFMEKRAAEQEARSAAMKKAAQAKQEEAKAAAQKRFASRKPNTSLIAASEPKPQSKPVSKKDVVKETVKKPAPKGVVEIQGKKYNTGGPAEKKMGELRKVQTPAAKKPEVKKPTNARTIGTGSFNPKTGQLEFKWNKDFKSNAKPEAKTSAPKAATKKPTVKKTEAKKPAPIKVKSTVVSSKPNVPGKELVVRPKGAVVSTANKTAAKATAKKLTAKGAALGAAKLASKAVTGKVGLAVTAGSVLAGPLLNQLRKDKNRVTSADVMKGYEQAAVKGNTKPSAKSTARVKDAGANKPTRVRDYESSGPTRTGGYTGSGASVGAGGSTYKVNAGDTLSGIAKRAGVTLSELRAANTNIKDPKKIYRNTTIKIPAKGKVPTGGYTGPVPYRPKKK